MEQRQKPWHAAQFQIKPNPMYKDEILKETQRNQ